MSIARNLAKLAEGINSAGALSSTKLQASGVTAGNYTYANITVNDKGIITAISSGSGVSTGKAIAMAIVFGG